jgi:hypothetical protein
MALPISPTPVLKGEDSKRFNLQLKKSRRNRISKAEREKGIALMKSVLKKANI